MVGTMNTNVDYSLVERWQTSQRWRSEASVLNAASEPAFERALSEMLAHIDKQRGKPIAVCQLVPDDR